MKKRIRYRIVCWLMRKFDLEESMHIYCFWDRNHHQIHKKVSSAVGTPTGKSRFYCPHCHEDITEDQIAL
jgi:hypothetical protein